MLSINVLGLRDLRGRFASMTNHGLVEIQAEELELAGKEIERVFRERAPHGSGASGEHFFQTIHAEVSVAGFGFTMAVTTSNPRLRGWLAEGTGEYAGHGRIYPVAARAMGPITDWAFGSAGGPYFFSSIAGMPARPWEEPARLAAIPLAEHTGSRIGQRVVVKLGTGL